MMKPSLIITALTLSAGMAEAATLTLDFNSGGTGCTPGVTVANTVSVTNGYCSGQPNDGYQYLEVGDTFTVTAAPGQTFDYLGANILYFWDETFALPVADVPNGIDLTNPADIYFVNENWLWQPAINALPLISIRGYASGVLTHLWSDIVMDTETYLASMGMTPPIHDIDWDPRDLPGGVMAGLDRLEISFAQPLVTASLEAPLLIGDAWYTRLPDGFSLVFDDLTLGISDTPAPVPLPLSALLLLAGIGAMGGLGRRQS